MTQANAVPAKAVNAGLDDAEPRVRGSAFLWAEFSFLFLIGPALFLVPHLVLYLGETYNNQQLIDLAPRLAVPPFLLLFAVCIYALVVLLRDRSFARRELWRGDSIRVAWPGLLLLGAPPAAGILLMSVLYGPDALPFMPDEPLQRGLVLGASGVAVAWAFGYTLVMLVADRSPALLTHRWPGVVLLFVPGAALMLGGVVLFEPERVFQLPVNKPHIWLVVMIFYPLVSVWPQELLYRTFFFHRYEALLGGRWPTVIWSAVTFGWMHVLFLNWIAVALTLLGGLIFAWRYDNTRSTLAVSVEHALYGQWIFTIGLGWYFFSGARAL